MSTLTLYGFLTDDALRPQVRVETNHTTMQTHGSLSGEMSNYLVNRNTLVDNRRNRLPLLNSTIPFGSMGLTFSGDLFDSKLFDTITDIEQTIFYNILERIYLQQNIQDETLETYLTTEPSYAGYVHGTKAKSTNKSLVTIYNNLKSHIDIELPDWISFEYQTNTLHLRVHIWIKGSSFYQNYPFTTILNVLAPYSPESLIDPVSIIASGGVEILTESSSFVFAKSDIEASLRDQTGIYTYYTKYQMTSDKYIQLPFGLPYSGSKVPTSLECRKAIKEYLEDTVSISPSEISSLFPELYINARFFVVPMWDMATPLTDREVLNSVINWKAMSDRQTIFYSDIDPIFRNNHMEVITNSHNTAFALSVPDELNEAIFSILEQHPTYQNYSSHTNGFRYLEAHTQEFSSKLSRAMSVAEGTTTNDNEFIETPISNYLYITFVAGKAEYLVMTRESYLKSLGVYGEV